MLMMLAAAVSTMALACGGEKAASNLKELQRAKSGDLQVVLLASGDALKEKDQATLEFRSGNALVDVGTVTMNATMAMGSGMPPMMGSSFVNRTDTPGRYAVETDMSMAGAWRFEIRWDGPAGKGSVTMPGTVR
jgi:YtkA-like